MRLFFLIALIVSVAMSAIPINAQQPAQPVVETELDAPEAVPGQYVTLRVTVLVPSWLPNPIEFPTMETPNLRVRLPERSTGPTSRRIDGENWSGVSRRYLISPMIAGTFDIPAQDISVTYAVPGGSDTVQATLQTDPVTITGTLPPGAEDLDPFIAATGLTLTQDVTQPTTGLQPGQSVTRTVTARMEGASPIVLPELMPEVEIDGIAVYPDEPMVAEQDDRGVLSGTRTESVTLMAESGAEGQVPGIELRWFNLDSGTIETATLDGFDISVEGAPASTPVTRDRLTLILAAAGLAAVAVLILLIWRIYPRATGAWRRRQAAHRATKAWAEREMLKAICRRDYPATLRAVDEWASRPPVTDAARIAPVHRALTPVGRSIYGRGDSPPMSGQWRAVREAVKAALVKPPPSAGNRLPSLNPEVAGDKLRWL